MLGQNQTTNFQIGNAEIRIGTMDNAGKLKQVDSVGLLQSATVKVSQESVDLKAGLPRTLIDTTVVETSITVEAQAYEYSRKNILTMTSGDLGSTAATAAQKDGVLNASVTAGAASIAINISNGVVNSTTVFPNTKFSATTDVTAGDLLVVYSLSNPEKMSVVKVDAGSITLSAGVLTIPITATGSTALLFDMAAGDRVYKANPVSLGGNVSTNYFTMDILGVDHTSGKPTGFRFWKAAVSGGMEYSFSNDNYAVTPLTFKVLSPSATEKAAGGKLAGVSSLIDIHPFGMYLGG